MVGLTNCLRQQVRTNVKELPPAETTAGVRAAPGVKIA